MARPCCTHCSVVVVSLSSHSCYHSICVQAHLCGMLFWNGDKNTLQKRFGTKDSVCCSEFRGGRFLEVANVLQVWDFQSVTRTLSALGSASASWSVRSGRFYCTSTLFYIVRIGTVLQERHFVPHNLLHNETQ